MKCIIFLVIAWAYWCIFHSIQILKTQKELSNHIRIINKSLVEIEIIKDELERVKKDAKDIK